MPHAQRVVSVDVLRGLAIVLMIQVHGVDHWANGQDSFGWLYDVSMLLGSVAAPLFTFLMGVSYSLWWHKQQATGQSERASTYIALSRGAFLFVLGLLFNIVVWLPDEVFNWDILTLLGTAQIVLTGVRWLPRPVLLLAGGLVVLLSPPLRVVSDFGAYWEDDYFAYDFTPRDIIFGYVVNGYFPLFPWLVFPVVGFVAAEWLFVSEHARIRRRFGWVACGMVALVVLLASVRPTNLPLLARYYASGMSEFPASTEYVVGMLGLVILISLLAHRWLDVCPRPALSWWVRACRRFSAVSLTIYVLHHPVILWPLWIWGACLSDQGTTRYWRDALPTLPATVLSWALVGVCFMISGWLERHPRYTLETQLRRWCG